jgi:hypothetical protein
MTYSIYLPDGYVQPALPGRNAWIADLLANPDKQRVGALGTPDGPNCCLGRLCLLQDRLTVNGADTDGGGQGIATSNPYSPFLGVLGRFPSGVEVTLLSDAGPSVGIVSSLAGCNDGGLSFAQIADIIFILWVDGGQLLD